MQPSLSFFVVYVSVLFNSMTKFRWEFLLQGTADGRTWHYYQYRNKPGGPPETLDELPKTLVLGHFNRADWRMWFIPLQAERILKMGLDVSTTASLRPGWYEVLVEKVLEGNPTVTSLLKVPKELQGKKLLAVRTLMSNYEFTDGKVSWKETHKDSTSTSSTSATDSISAASSSSGAGIQPVSLHSARTSSLPSRTEWEVGKVWKRKFVAIYNVKVASPEVQRKIIQEAETSVAGTSVGHTGSSAASGAAATSISRGAAASTTSQQGDSAAATAFTTGGVPPSPSKGMDQASTTTTNTATSTSRKEGASTSSSDAYRAYHGHFDDEDDDQDEEDEEDDDDDDEDEEEEEEEEEGDQISGTSSGGVRRRGAGAAKRDPLDLADD
jgi:Lipase maturation factor